MRIGYYDLTVKCMLLVGLTTLFTGLGFTSPINRVLTALLLGVQVLLLLARMTKKTFGCVVILIITTGYALINTSWPIETINELFYFPMWILLLCNFTDHYEGFISAIRENKQFMKFICVLWNLSVLVSLPFGRSYSKTGAFCSFAGSPHRYATGALLIIALVAVLYKLTGNKKVWFLAILPCFTTFLTGARTYMMVVGIAAVMIYYWMTKQKAVFYFTIVPIVAVAVYLVMNSSIMATRSEQMDQFADYTGDALVALTSGRTAWWKIDMEQIAASSFINQMLGNGFHFIRYVNTTIYGQNIWAHNDFIQLLGTSGFLSLLAYFYVYFRFSRFMYRKCRSSKRRVLIIAFHAMNFVNAMFNMLYTYACATFALFFFVIAFFDEENLGEVKLIIEPKQKNDQERKVVLK